jgi:dTDP-4-amino-4,6-dideoxygalactose transaminase
MMILMAEEIGPGDAVFLPAFTYTATAEVVLLLGARPIFVDVDRASFNLDPKALDAAIAKVRADGLYRPRAVIAVDLFGLAADYGTLRPLAAREGLVLIADAAQAMGAAIGNRRAGALADYTATSFYPAKALGCAGDGGAIFTDNAEKAAILKSIRFHGMGGDAYDHVRIGINGRLDTIQAAVLLVKLSIFEDECRRREEISRLYDARLAKAVDVPARPQDHVYGWSCYTVKAKNRDALREKLKANGVPTLVYYPKPLHFQPAYQAYGDGPGSMPVAEALAQEVLSLPIHPYLEDATVETICDFVTKAV